MKKAVQLAVGAVVIFGVAPFLFETPFNHWMVYSALLFGSLYATAVAQSYFHWRSSVDGASRRRSSRI